MLETLKKLTENPKLAEGDYHDVAKVLKKVGTRMLFACNGKSTVHMHIVYDFHFLNLCLKRLE